MLINILVPPSNHILQQAKKSPRLNNVNFPQLVLVVSKNLAVSNVKNKSKSSNSYFNKYEQER